MKLSKKLTPIALAVSMAAGSMIAPGIASAEVTASASVGIANMYLWRGQNLTPDGPQIHGDLNFDFGNGAYAGVWTTNETGGHETDLYAGFAFDAGPVALDISYWHYLYPEDGGTGDGTGLGDTALSEVVIGAGMGDFGVTAYVSVETQDGPDWVYYTLDYTMGDYNILFGGWSIDADGAEEYTHLTLSYAFSDNLSFAVSMAQEDNAGGIEEDPLFYVGYSLPLDMK